MRDRQRNAGRGRRLGWTAGLFLASTAAILSFQNCTQPVLTDEGDVLESQAAKLNFAYDTTLDQIAYMSCANAASGSYDPGAFFTFRVGAYRNGGVRLSDAFRTEMKQKSEERQLELLNASPANAFTNIQVAIRQTNQLRGIFVSTTPKRGEDYVNLLEPLGTVPMSSTLLQSDPAVRIKYLRNGTVWGSRMEGSLYFTASPVAAASVRTFLGNSNLLALTYTHATPGATATDYIPRGPADVFEDATDTSDRSVFGRGYSLRFSQPAIAGLHGQFPANTLTDVSERNLENAADSTGNRSWTCPSQLQFRIVRYEDFALNTPGINCQAVLDPLSGPAATMALLQLARNSLRTEDWYIDLNNKCIIPKKPSNVCYNPAAPVKYDVTAECGTQANPQACLNMVSICYRND